MRRALTLWALLLGGAVGAIGQAHAEAAGQWRDSAHLWRATCAHCHATGVAPELRGRAWTAEAFGVWMRRGPGAMPSFGPGEVSDAEVAALARWTSQQAAPSPASTQAGRP